MHRAAEWRPRPGGPGPLFLFCFQRCLQDWIEKMKKSNQLIMGIGHRIKSLANPDQRVGAQVQSHNGSCTKWRARWRSSRVSPRRTSTLRPFLTMLWQWILSFYTPKLCECCLHKLQGTWQRSSNPWNGSLNPECGRVVPFDSQSFRGADHDSQEGQFDPQRRRLHRRVPSPARED